MSFFDQSWNKLKIFGTTLLTMGKQNAPTLMTGGSVILGWTAVYFFWRDSRKADKKIEYEEFKINGNLDADAPPEAKQQLSKKDKFIIYLQYCWISLVLGIGSSALAIGANSINLSRLAEMALLTQFMDKRNGEQNILVDKLKEELPNKTVYDITHEMYHETADTDAIVAKLKEMIAKGDKRTLFVDSVNRKMWPDDILHVTNGIASFNEMLQKKRTRKMEESMANYQTKLEESVDSLTDPFYVNDGSPWWKGDADPRKIETIMGITAVGDLSDFLYSIGEISSPKEDKLGELLEFRCFGGEAAVPASEILNFDTDYRMYFDKNEQVPEVCFVDYKHLLYPSYELIERDYV